MSKNKDENKDKFWFKIDKDKIKLQLKDIGDKFVDSRNKKRKISIFITICLIFGLGLALYINYNQTSVVPDMNADIQLEPTDTLPQEKTEEGEGVKIVSNPRTGTSLDLNQENLTLENIDSRKPDPAVQKSNSDNSSIDNRTVTGNESEVTAPLKPLDRTTGDNSLNLLKPVSGKIIQKPGWYYHPVFQDWRYQTGLKLEGQTGDVVMAAMGGEVSSVREDQYLGITVTLQHENGWKTIYGHLNKASVFEGNVIARGQEVGKVGQSGLLDNPALYFELTHNGEAIEASKYFE